MSEERPCSPPVPGPSGPASVPPEEPMTVNDVLRMHDQAEAGDGGDATAADRAPRALPRRTAANSESHGASNPQQVGAEEELDEEEDDEDDDDEDEAVLLHDDDPSRLVSADSPGAVACKTKL